MNPILLGKQVEQGLKDLVMYNFQTNSNKFEGMVDAFLSDPHAFIKGPWVTVELPFQDALSNSEPFPEIPLGFEPHRHQERVFERLRLPNPKSTLIATGTGSGKTEAYLWPILDVCRLNMAKPGIKAIVIYPMNALATDQARRIAKVIHETPALKGIRCGLYADAQPDVPNEIMSKDQVITSRKQILEYPPDILLTNYKMLDLLLLRSDDKKLWAKNSPETLQFLVVDELHTFDGAQGTDLALLIRRLKARLKTPTQQLTCVGSSATLGIDEKSQLGLKEYAEKLFGEPFDPNCVIIEDRKELRDQYENVDYINLPNAKELEDAIKNGLERSQPEAVYELALLFFDDQDLKTRNADNDGDCEPSDKLWRINLGKLLWSHFAFQRVIAAIHQGGKAVALEEIAEKLSGAKFLRSKWSKKRITALVEAIVILASWARRKKNSNSEDQPLLNIRIQSWVREMGRMLAILPEEDEYQGVKSAVLRHTDDLDEQELSRALPVVICINCGLTGLACRINLKENHRLWETPSVLYAEWFDKSDLLRILFFEEIKVQSKVAEINVNPRTLEFNTDKDYRSRENFVTGWLYDPTDDKRSVERTCPSCGTELGLLILGLRTARLTAGLTTTLFNSEHHEANESKPRVLMFSDSVQDAAQRAAVNEIRNKRLVVEKTTYKIINDQVEQKLNLNDLTSKSIDEILSSVGDAEFVAKYIARDQTWRNGYQSLLKCNEANDFSDEHLPGDVAKRLGWDIFANLTFRSRTGQTLETSNLCIADVHPNKLLDPTEAIQQKLQAEYGPGFYLDDSEVFSLLFGIVTYMRRNGAIAHYYISQAVQGATRKNGLDFYGANRRLKLKNRGVFPNLNAVGQISPVIPATGSLKVLKGTNPPSNRQFKYVGGKQRSNWYREWIYKFFPLVGDEHTKLYKIVYNELYGNNLAVKIETFGSENLPVWLLRPDAVSVSTRVEVYYCDNCGRRECFHKYDFSPIRCLKIGCQGYLRSRNDSADDRENDGSSTEGTGHSTYFKNILSTKKNHRVVAREHTGLLEAEDRRTIEDQFVNGEKSWFPNLISATPTLELGIDIGKLSTLILASVPPDVANYVQRIGRTGRRDGNSLNITLVAARPHDLQFWEDPKLMLEGQITPPGVYLEAIAVLRRQVAAFALDRFVAEEDVEFGRGVVKNAIVSIEREILTEFPFNWFTHLEHNAKEISNDFIDFLPEDVKSKEAIRTALTAYLQGVKYNNNKGLRANVEDAFNNVKNERAELNEIRKKLDKERRSLKSIKPNPSDLDVQLKRLKKRRAEITKTISETIDNVNVLKFLNDRGLLPNYAFPEEGVKLKSIIVRERDEIDKFTDEDVRIKEYQRPASIAITELALDQKFYAEGREVKINRLDLQENDITDWRFCQNCTYSEKNDTGETKAVCPKCSSKAWSDIGSCVQIVELKSVVANTSEQKAAIQDLDGRLQRNYDTEIIPNYSHDQVEKAYILVESEKPFGIEFISLCEFRHINFGERAPTGTKIQIAGQERNTRPFKICKSCGTLQKSGYDGDSHNISRDHEARCPVVLDLSVDKESSEATVFLVNTFNTEALRMIVPVPGEANFDEIKSFVAGVELGLRQFFQGRVDHIRSTVVKDSLESGASVRNLFFYDTIPGGSGYLRQLAVKPESLWEVFNYATNALRACPCNKEEGKNGCFRCVKPYRSLFGRGEPKRDTALHLIDAVLSNWDSLKEVRTSIDKDLGPSILESALEDKFIHYLKDKFKSENLKSLVLDNGRRGFQLKVPLKDDFYTSNDTVSNSETGNSEETSDTNVEHSPPQGKSTSSGITSLDDDKLTSETLTSEEESTIDQNSNHNEPLIDENEKSNNNSSPKEKCIYWTIEPQVQIDKRFPGLPKKRVDFLITSTHPKAIKPIVVELDGFKYHYDTVKKDVEDRIRMIKSGQVEVWTILWDDFNSKTSFYHNPFGANVINTQFDEGLKKLFLSPDFKSLHHCRRTVEILRSESSINGLLELLRCNPWSPSEASTLLAFIYSSATTKNTTPIESKELDEDSRFFWQEADQHLRLTDRSVSLFAGIPTCKPIKIADCIDSVRMVLFADLEEIDEDHTNQDEFKMTWSSLWRSINLLQTLSGFHVVLPGMDALEASLTPDLKQLISDQTNVRWQEVFELTEEEVLGTLNSLFSANCPVPDMVGADIVVNDTVTCTVEFGWSQKQFAVSLDASVADGWTIIEYVDPKSADYAEFLQKIIDVVSGGE